MFYITIGLLSLAFLNLYALKESSKHEGIEYSWHIPISYNEISNWSKVGSYQIASYLTDPLCKFRELSVQAQLSKDLPPPPYLTNCAAWISKEHEKSIASFMEQSLSLTERALFCVIAPFTASSGLLLRFVTSNIEKEPFIHYRGHFPEKEMEENTLSHLLWNICGVHAGYEIEEGAQTPIRENLLPLSETRIANIAHKISEENPDIVCLNEVFDIQDALYLVDFLKNKYAHFVIQCGARTIGLNSGLFFATKFALKDIAFTPFPKEMLVGKTQYAEKGFLSVHIEDGRGPIANIVLTHLQHSDEPEFPTQAEKKARSDEIKFILEKIDLSENLIFNGDLNLDDEELMNLDCLSQFRKVSYFDPFENEEPYTWLGDEWYVQYGNQESTFSPVNARHELKRKVSSGRNLDHVLISKGAFSRNKVETFLKATGYDPKKISRSSMSDHMILLSSIELDR